MAHSAPAHSSEEMHGSGDHHGPGFYIKIWALLLLLLVISIVGPMFGHVWVTLVTAFGIAFIKAGIVGAYFMHLNIEKKYILYLLYTMVLLMTLLFMGVAPDVMQYGGANWINKASHNLVEQYKQGGATHTGGHH